MSVQYNFLQQIQNIFHVFYKKNTLNCQCKQGVLNILILKTKW
jgi:hypothetical protein